MTASQRTGRQRAASWLLMIVRDGAFRAGWQSVASGVGRVGRCAEVRGDFESDQEIQIRTIDVF